MSEFDDLMKYLAQQFPATVGHFPIRQKIEALEIAAQRKGIMQAVKKIEEVKKDWLKCSSYTKVNAADYLIYLLTENSKPSESAPSTAH